MHQSASRLRLLNRHMHVSSWAALQAECRTLLTFFQLSIGWLAPVLFSGLREARLAHAALARCRSGCHAYAAVHHTCLVACFRGGNAAVASDLQWSGPCFAHSCSPFLLLPTYGRPITVQAVPAAPAAALAGAPPSGARLLGLPVRQPVRRCACCAALCMLCWTCLLRWASSFLRCGVCSALSCCTPLSACMPNAAHRESVDSRPARRPA